MEWQHLKEQGNLKFNQGAYEEADLLYTSALDRLDDNDSEGKLSLLLNKCFCNIKQQRFWEACSVALLCLHLDEFNAKGYFRLASALVGAGCFKIAVEVIDVASAIARYVL